MISADIFSDLLLALFFCGSICLCLHLYKVSPKFMADPLLVLFRVFLYGLVLVISVALLFSLPSFSYPLSGHHWFSALHILVLISWRLVGSQFCHDSWFTELVLGPLLGHFSPKLGPLLNSYRLKVPYTCEVSLVCYNCVLKTLNLLSL